MISARIERGAGQDTGQDGEGVDGSTGAEARLNVVVKSEFAATDAKPTSSINPAILQSCQFCRKRKIKCDKALPKCSHCIRAQTLCVYPPSQRRGRPRATGKQIPPPATPREEQLLKKIKRLESVIDSLKGDDHEGRVLDSNEGDPIRQRLGSLVIGKPYINDTFWYSEELKDILEGGGDDDSFSGDEDSSMASGTVKAQHMLFEPEDTVQDSLLLHPPSSQVATYWNVYCENAESVLRLLHTPSVEKIIKITKRDAKRLSKSENLLILSVYFAAVATLTADEVLQVFGSDKEQLLRQYESGIKQGLWENGFLRTHDIMVLQAYVLYLICLRHSDGEVVWTFTGLAIRIAQGMGIDRDGELFDLPPFEVEMRRRLWHSILILDVRASEAKGVLPTLLYYDTKLPANINDSDISPGSERKVESREGYTDMTIALLRYDVLELGRRLLPNPFQASLSVEEKENLVDSIKEEMQDKYLRFCDTEGAPPLAHFGSAIAKLITSRMKLMLYNRQQDQLPQETRDRLFDISIDIVELSYNLKLNPLYQKYEWIFRSYVQWPAIATLLKELLVRPRTLTTNRAWKAIDLTSPDWITPIEGETVVSLSVRKLYVKAQAQRLAQIQKDELDAQKQYFSQAPAFQLPASAPAPVPATLPFAQATGTFPVNPVNSWVQDQPVHHFPTTFPPAMPTVDTMNMYMQPLPLYQQGQVPSWIVEPPEPDYIDVANLPNQMIDDNFNGWESFAQTHFRYGGNG